MYTYMHVCMCVLQQTLHPHLTVAACGCLSLLSRSVQKKLRERVDELEDALPMAMGVSQGAIAAYLPPALNRSASSLSDGSVVSLSVSELHKCVAVAFCATCGARGVLTAVSLP